MNDRAGQKETTSEPSRLERSPTGYPADRLQVGVDLLVGLQRSAGNAAVGALLSGHGDGVPRGAVAQPNVRALIARRRLLQRQSPTREEMLAGLKRDRAAAAAPPYDLDKWKEVALRLNGFNKEDIARQTSNFSVAEIWETRTAVTRFLAGWPEQQTILSALDAAPGAKRGALRPASSSIWTAYSNLSYDVWKGPDKRRNVWEFIGGSVGGGFGPRDDNTCAARVSYAFNYGGYPIRGAKPGWSYPNDPKTTYGGKSGDAKRYIVSAPYMQEYLTTKWGKPDATLRDKQEAANFELTLRPDQVAVFAGAHHSGFIKQGYRTDYIHSDPDVMPVVAWKLQ